MDIAISVQQVSKTFGQEEVLHAVSHDFEEGQNPWDRGQQRQRKNRAHEMHLRLSAPYQRQSARSI